MSSAVMDLNILYKLKICPLKSFMKHLSALTLRLTVALPPKRS